jgi:D-alanyl-D-alanine carboxypeptidase (penicillin-binding protein 5/6)
MDMSRIWRQSLVVCLAGLMAAAAGAAEPDGALQAAARTLPVSTADGSKLATAASHIVLVDAATHTVLAEKAADAQMYPSSMTKMMTLYVTFEKLKQGAIKLDTPFTVSEKAWRMGGSKMFVPLGASIPLEELIRGIAIQSGNDACIAVAEGIAGSEEAFAKQMNDAAAKLWMKNSHFMDSSGWPDAQHYSTPRDLATLAEALIRDFPQYYHYFGEKEFVYNGIHQFNRNLLLGDPALGVDGLKTGHTDAAGYGITLSGKEPSSGRRLILVINGLDSEAARAEEGRALLTWGFRNFKNVTLANPGQAMTQAQVWLGKEKTVGLTITEPLLLTVPVGVAPADVKLIASYPKPIAAPIAAGQEIGKLKVVLPTGASKEVSLVAVTAVEKKGAIGKLFTLWASWLGM